MFGETNNFQPALLMLCAFSYSIHVQEVCSNPSEVMKVHIIKSNEKINDRREGEEKVKLFFAIKTQILNC